MPCISLQAYSLMMMNGVCIMIWRYGWKGLLPRNHIQDTDTILTKTMRMLKPPATRLHPGDFDRPAVAVTNGKLDFGPWEQIFYGEFDGMRKKRVLVKIIGE